MDEVFSSPSEARMSALESSLKKPVNRRTFLLGSMGTAVAGGAVLLGGCSSNSNGAASKSGGKTTVSFMLDFLPNVDDVFMDVAVKMGYFDDEGIAVNFVNPSTDSNATPILVGQGRYDFGCQTVGTTLFARSKGVPVLCIGGIGHRAECLFWLPPASVTSPHSLVGKTVANYQAADFESFLISYMKSGGLSLSDVSEVFVGDTATTEASGRVYAAIGIRWGEVIDTANITHKQPDTLPFFSPTGEELYGIPQSNYLVLFTSENFANKNPDVVKGFVRALSRGYKKSFVMPTSDLSPIMNTWASTGANATGTLADNMQKFQASRPYAFFGSNQDPNSADYMQMPLSSFPNVAKWLVSSGQASSLNVTGVATNEFVTAGALNPSV